jgi:hypothetical protein
MLPFRKRLMINDSKLFEINQERMISENLLNQRLSIFLILFALVVAGAVTTQKKLFFIVVLFIGSVLCWVLAYAIFGLARRIGFLVKELSRNDDSGGGMGYNKGSGRSVRLLLGFFVPIFCSSVLTLALLLAVSGTIDQYLWFTPAISAPLENKIDKIKTEIKDQIVSGKRDSSKNFTSVDSVILRGQTVKPVSQLENMERDVKKQITPSESTQPNDGGALKGRGSQRNFKSIDSVISYDKPLRTAGATGSSANAKKASQVRDNSSKNFNNIDNIIIKENPSRPKSALPSPQTAKKSSPLKENSSRNFNSIDDVINKEKDQ